MNTEVDYSSIVDSERSTETGVAHGKLLLGFTEAVVARDSTETALLRRRLRSEMGDPALVDICGVIANFHRMTRIADGTGIPLDDTMLGMTEDLRKDLAVNQYGSAENTFGK